MNTDKYFEIGSDHTVCQDFALDGNIGNIYFAIITDGCSESHELCGEVDFGARAVAYLAREAIKGLALTFLDDNEETLHTIGKTIRNKIIEKLKPLRNHLGLDTRFSDSTLVIAITDGKVTYAYIFGDGGVITVNKSDTIKYNEVHFLSSAPLYLSYINDVERMKAYQLSFGSTPVLNSMNVIPFDGDLNNVSSVITQIKEINEDLYKLTSFIFKDITSISVVSDGVKSFQTIDKEINSIPSINIVKKLVAFKNTKGEFTKRRMNFFNKDNKANNVSHYDDISIATIIL